MRAIPETNWKKLRAPKTRELNDACARILEVVAPIVQQRDGREREAYLALWELLQKQDELVAAMFDDFHSSTACYKLARWQRHGVVAESDVGLFTAASQATVKTMNQTGLTTQGSVRGPSARCSSSAPTVRRVLSRG
jgi:hypothetical protein